MNRRRARKGTRRRVRGPAGVAGKTIAVGTATNQEKILLDWSERNEKAGRRPVDIRYHPKTSDTHPALRSGRIDAYFGPNPSVVYHVNTAGRTQSIGRFSGGGDVVRGTIAATTKKGSGPVGAYAAALRAVIADGSYRAVLDRWGLGAEALTTSQINPPGLPRTH